MNPVADEDLLAALHGWLVQTRVIGDGLGGGEGLAGEFANGHPPTVGLMRLVEEFTALRQEVKLQTRGARGLEEQAVKQADSLRQAIEALKSIEPREQQSAWTAGKGLALALAELDESLERGRRQLERTIASIVEDDLEHDLEHGVEHDLEHGVEDDEDAVDHIDDESGDVEDELVSPDSANLLRRLEEAYRALPPVKRWLSRDYHRAACKALEAAVAEMSADRTQLAKEVEAIEDESVDEDPPSGSDPAAERRVAQLAALRDGYAIVQNRLTRALAAEGIARIVTDGEMVDPEQMLVLETVEADAPAGMVVEEVRPGYVWKGRLLRCAEVRAARSDFWS